VQVRKVIVRNFRGITAADWVLPPNRFVCLVGPGDSTKTTLLDVVSLVLSPRWNVAFTDADFFSCLIDEPIELQVVIGDLPNYLLRDTTHGHDQSGLMPNGELVHDPIDDAEPCLIIQLKVTDSLEPSWTIVRPGAEDDGTPIGSRTASNLASSGWTSVSTRICGGAAVRL
jgi:putative ATP-dependent endonuclease of the OLD family